MYYVGMGPNQEDIQHVFNGTQQVWRQGIVILTDTELAFVCTVVSRYTIQLHNLSLYSYITSHYTVT